MPGPGLDLAAKRRSRPRTALVLPGGAALGAYEVGVVAYVLDELARDLGGPPPLDVLCGTSVGAFNACLLAAFADDDRARTARLAAPWNELRVDRFLRPDALRAVEIVCDLVCGRPPRRQPRGRGALGLLRADVVDRLVKDSIPFPRIAEQLAAGRLAAVTVSTTQVATGRATVWWAGDAPTPIGPPGDRSVLLRECELRPAHALASAAIPLLYAPVDIDGELHVDGGLRLNVPLAPALHLGGERLLVVSPHHVAADDETQRDSVDGVGRLREAAFASPLFLVGKMLNALLLDRIDNDVDRVSQIDEVLAAGTAAYGADFTARINRALIKSRGHPLRHVRAVVVRASQPLGRLGADYVRSSRFHARSVSERVLRRLAELEGDIESDLLSYLLFDGNFARELIELGRRDARAKHDELLALFADSMQGARRESATH